jgi:hypothetical protein
MGKAKQRNFDEAYCVDLVYEQLFLILIWCSIKQMCLRCGSGPMSDTDGGWDERGSRNACIVSIF